MITAGDGDKQRLRAAMRARRMAIPLASREAGAMCLARQGLACLEQAPAGCLSGYLAIAGELDPLTLMERCRAAGAALALPVVVGKGAPLVFRAWTSGDPLAGRAWGIREPIESAPELVPDLLLVPLLAVDRAGWRLGYGGGFYDRTIRALRAWKPIVAIGIAFDEQIVDAVPHSVYDERLDWVLTPSGPIDCRER